MFCTQGTTRVYGGHKLHGCVCFGVFTIHFSAKPLWRPANNVRVRLFIFRLRMLFVLPPQCVWGRRVPCIVSNDIAAEVRRASNEIKSVTKEKKNSKVTIFVLEAVNFTVRFCWFFLWRVNVRLVSKAVDCRIWLFDVHTNVKIYEYTYKPSWRSRGAKRNSTSSYPRYFTIRVRSS